MPAVREVRMGPTDVRVEQRTDGALLLRSPHALCAAPRRITDCLEHWAEQAPERTFLAQRRSQGDWRHLSYREALAGARRIGAALLARGLSAERPVVVLSGNDIEHALLELGALLVGIPYAPVSPAYSLLSNDFGKLRHAIGLLTPGLVLAAEPGTEVDAARDAVGADTIAKFLFTSGSTGLPKAVINTQGMWCSNQQMIRSMLAFLQDEPPVLVDWAPWHHTAAGNHDFGLVLVNGGSYYIDEGKPLPGAIEASVRNLREIAPTFYFNVPRGFDALLPYLRDDAALRRNFFSRVKLLWFAGAGVSQRVFDEYKALAIDTCGEAVLFGTGLGSTETAPFTLARTWDTADASNMGVPPPGIALKLVPLDGEGEARFEMRIRGPHITPGYWRDPGRTGEAFDAEGFYRLGDAFALADASDASKGLLYRGRIAEEFKLPSGTWVQVGALRSRMIAAFAPLVRDVVITGAGREWLGALLIPEVAACAAEGGGLRASLQSRLDAFAATATGSSNRIARAVLLDEPLSLDAGEVTDKGTINQRAVLEHREALVEALYEEVPGPGILVAAA